MEVMKAFRNKNTGIISNMPEHLEGLFDYLEPVEDSENTCVTCEIKVPADDDENEEGY